MPRCNLNSMGTNPRLKRGLFKGHELLQVSQTQVEFNSWERSYLASRCSTPSFFVECHGLSYGAPEKRCVPVRFCMQLA